MKGRFERNRVGQGGSYDQFMIRLNPDQRFELYRGGLPTTARITAATTNIADNEPCEENVDQPTRPSGERQEAVPEIRLA